MDLNSSYVYVLPLKDKSSFKVGVSSSIYKRVARLSRFYDLNLENIFLLDCLKPSAAYEIEQALHSALKTHKMNLQGEGGTEFFDYVSLPGCLSILNSIEVLHSLSSCTLSFTVSSVENTYETFDPSIFGLKIGQVIKQHRLDLNVSQKSLAKKVGCGRQTLTKLEDGYIEISLKTLLRTLDVLGIELGLPKSPKSPIDRKRARH